MSFELVHFPRRRAGRSGHELIAAAESAHVCGDIGKAKRLIEAAMEAYDAEAEALRAEPALSVRRYRAMDLFEQLAKLATARRALEADE